MGDLSGKLGALRLEPLTANPRKTYAFYDDNLHLLGPLTSELYITYNASVHAIESKCDSYSSHTPFYKINVCSV